MNRERIGPPAQLLLALEEVLQADLATIEQPSAVALQQIVVQFLTAWLPLRPHDFNAKADRTCLLRLVERRLHAVEASGQVKLLLLHSV